MSFGWTHIATRQGSVRRAIAYVQPSTNNYHIPDYWYRAVKQIVPVRPLGPAFYYSVPVERKFEARRAQWEPVDKLDNKAAGAFLPGYFVSDAVLDSLKPAAYPTCWVTDDIDSIPAAEKAKLTRIAPLCDIDTMERVAAPVRFEGDATGYGFVDKQERVIILALREYWLNQTDITAKANLSGFADGSYTARDLLDTSKTFAIAISGGTGSFSFPLAKWDARAFVTDLRPPAIAAAVTCAAVIARPAAPKVGVRGRTLVVEDVPTAAVVSVYALPGATVRPQWLRTPDGAMQVRGMRAGTYCVSVRVGGGLATHVVRLP